MLDSKVTLLILKNKYAFNILYHQIIVKQGNFTHLAFSTVEVFPEVSGPEKTPGIVEVLIC